MVLLSSHILAEVEALCDCVTIISEGRTIEEGTLDELRHLTRTTIRCETERSAEAVATLAASTTRTWKARPSVPQWTPTRSVR